MSIMRKEFVSGFVVAMLVVAGGLSDATARSKDEQRAVTQLNTAGIQRYIIELQDQPLAIYDGRALSVPSRHDKSQLAATNIQYTGEYRLDVNAPTSMDYLEFLSDRQDAVLHEVAIKLGRHVTPNSTYQNALNGMALLILTSILLRREGYLQTVMSPEHHHIMGKLTFAFVVFWAYVTFSQFFLIWYANITEETSYFLLRNTGNWNVANIALVFGHFALPFLFLIRSDVKKKPALMIPITIYLFILHALDHYLIVAPERGPSLTLGSEAGASLFPSGSVVWYDLLAFVTVGAFFLFVYLRMFTKNSLYPCRDPRILESANLFN